MMLAALLVGAGVVIVAALALSLVLAHMADRRQPPPPQVRRWCALHPWISLNNDGTCRECDRLNGGWGRPA